MLLICMSDSLKGPTLYCREVSFHFLQISQYGGLPCVQIIKPKSGASLVGLVGIKV